VKYPPAVDRSLALTARPAAVRRPDLGFLPLVAVLLVGIAMVLKSGLVSHSQVWLVGTVMVAVGGPAVLLYLGASGRPSMEHLVPCLLGALAVAGLSLMISQWWKFGLAALFFGVSFFLSGRLDSNQLRTRQSTSCKTQAVFTTVLQWALLALALSGSYLVILTMQWALPVRLGGVSVASLLATYRSFRTIGEPLPPVKALYHSIFVAQLIFFFTWGMSYWVYFTEGVFAVLLFLLWYVNSGLIRHLEEKSFNRNVGIEYVLFGVLFIYLFAVSFQPH
jgi:hypothetical protein